MSVSADQLAADVRTIRQAMWLHEEPGTRRREFITAVDRLVARLEAAERERDRLVCSWCGDDFEQGDFASTSCCSCDPVSASSLPGLLKDARREAREAIEEGFAAEAALADMRRALEDIEKATLAGVALNHIGWVARRALAGGGTEEPT